MYWAKILLVTTAWELRQIVSLRISNNLHFTSIFLTFIENLALSVVPADHIFHHLILYGGLKIMSITWIALHVLFVVSFHINHPLCIVFTLCHVFVIPKLFLFFKFQGRKLDTGDGELPLTCSS